MSAEGRSGEDLNGRTRGELEFGAQVVKGDMHGTESAYVYVHPTAGVALTLHPEYEDGFQPGFETFGAAEAQAAGAALIEAGKQEERAELLAVMRGFTASENQGDVAEQIEAPCGLAGIPEPEGSYLDGWTAPGWERVRQESREIDSL